MTSERPILFNGPMVRAILEGKKTQTRRIVKPQPPNGAHPFFIMCSNREKDEGKWRFTANKDHLSGTVLGPIACPYGKPGDRLWVRETWLHIDDEGDKFDGMGSQTYYRASSGPRDAEYMKQRGLVWRPSIFMPRWASRITLEITGVRVERLQGISHADAREEGVTDYRGKWWDGSPVVCGHWDGPAGAYRGLWQSIHGPGSWDANPWVWVVEFRRVTTSMEQKQHD